MPEIDESGERILRCDFCGEVVASVRRVAIDTDYERLQTPHKELYACESCSVKKERARLGLDAS
jgi:uncharacterized protein with PIN domain